MPLTTPLTDYEKDFIISCKSNKIKVFRDDDGCPICVPSKKSRRGYLSLCPWSKDVFAIVMIANDFLTPKRLISRLRKRNITFEIYKKLASECIIFVDNKDLLKTAKTLRMKIRKEITEEQKKIIADRLSKSRRQ